MPIDEVFARPLVKTVTFQVTFPNLFSIDSRVGDFQAAIMEEFPESALLLQQHFMLVHRVGESKESPPEPAQTQQIWQFKNSSDVNVNLTRDSLVVRSKSHKSYNQSTDNRFRDVVELVCGSFFKIVRVPLIYRIGLRYINNCPLAEKSTARYREYYNGALPLDRFPLEDAQELETKIVAPRGTATLRFLEKFEVSPQGCRLILDMDTWKERIESSKILETADTLHDVISSEFDAYSTDALKTYMRTTDGESP